MRKNIFISFLFLCFTYYSSAQEKTEYAENTFFTNRIINGHSVEITPAGKLNFIISHRLGRINDGLSNFFGLDQATSRLGLEYGLNDWLMAGVGRSTNEKLVDGFIKAKILRQSSGKRVMPFTVTYFTSMAINTMKTPETQPTGDVKFSNRLFYTHQILVARKFSDHISLQLMPSLIHRNLVATRQDKNDVYSIGFAGRYKIASRMAITAEYYYVLPSQIKSQYNGMDVVNSFSVGLDIYTGKHTFQLQISNSTTMAEKAFITETTEKWTKGNIHIGFNISRLFNIINY